MGSDSLQSIASDFYAFQARRFPVCSWSDEFYYFPQALDSGVDWSVWDDFSPEGVEDAVSVLKKFRIRLEGVTGEGGNSETDRILQRLLQWHLEVLTEQLEEIRGYTRRPTFFLTVATSGLIQSLQHPDVDALKSRLEALPSFLADASESLQDVPTLFRDLGLEMAGELARWITTLEGGRELAPAISAVSAFRERVSGASGGNRFQTDPDHLERIVNRHTGSGTTVAEVLEELEDEEGAMLAQLSAESRGRTGSHEVTAFLERLEHVTVPGGGKIELVAREADRLREHCARLGIEAVSRVPEVEVRDLPPSFGPIRAADSYNARPGHPFGGGVFYIFGDGTLGRAGRTMHPSFRMTVAHETFPGHHLLDACRWDHPDPVRRPLEHPLFYEGWACFGEDLMFATGAFEGSGDRLLLCMRRYRHAVRGRTELLLNLGRIDLDAAAGRLLAAGFGRERAEQTVRKYALQPGYQMCYTIGRRRFQALFDSSGGGGIPDFVNTVLSEGEILFEDLENVLKTGRGPRGAGRNKTDPGASINEQ